MTEEVNVNPEQTAEKPKKAPKAPAPKKRYWITGAANPSTSIYGQIQLVVHANPGMTVDELLPHLIAGVQSTKSTKDVSFFTGYLAGGERRGYLTSDESAKSTELNVKMAAVREKKEKAPGATSVQEEILKALEKIVTDAEVERTNPISAATLSEALKKPIKNVARSLKSLEKAGKIVIVLNDDTTIGTVSLVAAA